MPTIEQYLTKVNYTPGRLYSVNWLAIHYTSGSKTSAGAALANCKYFYSVKRGASAHYFIDDGDVIYQSVRDTDTAWAVGTKSGYKCGCRNNNSISIEVCTDGAFTAKEIENLRWLVGYLMNKYNISPDHVVRHYDVTGKMCPAYYVNNPQAWKDLHAYITGGISSAPVATETTAYTPQESSGIAVDGIWGSGTTRALQKRMGTVQDGIISGQLSKPSVCISWRVGRGGSLCIKGLQRMLGVTADGYCGKNTTRALQTYLGVTADGIIGKNTVKALQRWLNS